MYSITVEQPDTTPVALPHVPSLETIQAFEKELLKLPQHDFEVRHHFADGIYSRELVIPAGCVLTGKIHRTEHMNFLIKGEITVWTEDGMKRLKAPVILVSRPGTKRVGYAHEETIWVTVHGTHETDLERLEAELIEPETHLIAHKEGLPCLG